ncbi:metallophosphoesterase [Virgibacillus pantothenticus]|uniref:metallophosphoesterase n=1 Tax=Virgibacillus pantothenticus TaxID=1473 RepID=UPI0009E2DB29|nr:metallophosphoesterase [Virgibacillus pantothenticus]MBU8642155.1 metallophosphoesterase [Virgibacillus pantothenticus]MBU8645862.1 metallophosphoesterase [Virgibacillus pantothenticus]MBU8659408.1 metallophosphoesterase [Virgibacillus pantothenticus]MBU8668196.1 metallophosphoesterase [Virgibacillus pantothenticus]MBU8672422.1 metallophosphoesterase [Virgibacillus pantothenticus]
MKLIIATGSVLEVKKKLFIFVLIIFILFTQMGSNVRPVYAEGDKPENQAPSANMEEPANQQPNDVETTEENDLSVEQHSENQATDSKEEEQPEQEAILQKEKNKDDLPAPAVNMDSKQKREEVKRQVAESSKMEEKGAAETVNKPYIVLEDFEQGLGSWTVSGARHNKVDIGISNEVVRFDNQALRLEYDFLNTQGTSGIYASLGDKIEIPGKPKKIGMWVYGDGHKHWLRQQLTDANGQNFNIDYTGGYPNGVTWEGWKYVEAPIPDNWQAPFTIGSQAIRYMATNDQAKSAGIMYIDNIRAVYGDTDEDVINPTITNVKPANGEIADSNKPEISAIVSDGDGLGIDPKKISLTINGEQVSASYDAKSGLVSYTPQKALAEGLNRARIEVFDQAGNHKFQSWEFHVSSGGPTFTWKGPDKIYAGSSFEVDVTMQHAKALSGTKLILTYDSNLLKLHNETGVKAKAIIPEKLQQAVVENSVNEETGEIILEWGNLEDVILSDDEVLATLRFNVGIDAAGGFEIALAEGTQTFVDDAIGTIPFYANAYKNKISQPLVLSIEGKSLHTPSTMKVVDQEGNPVGGAKIDILGDQKLIQVKKRTHIYKGGSGIAGEPFQIVEAGTYIPVAKTPNEGFDFYRIYMPDGQQRYFHVPKDDVEEVDWSSLLNLTGANGETKTNLLTLSQISLKLQASKGKLVSQVLSFKVLPQLGDQVPEKVTLTWTKDPKTTQHVTWRTNTTAVNPVLEVVAKGDKAGFDSEHVLRFKADTKLVSDETGEFLQHNVEATKLTPSTTYQYRVGDGTEEVWSEVSTFTTESASNDDPFRFLLFTDTQAYDQAGFALWTKLYETALEKFPDTKFSVHGGDIVEEGNRLAQWDEFLTASEGLVNKVPFMAVMGNHDVYGNGENTYKTLFPYPKNGPKGKENFVYSFDYGNVRFIMLNSEFGVKDMEEQQAWIKEEVKNSDKLWNIAVFHRPPYKSNPKRGTDATIETFAPVLEGVGVDLVLTGHDHAYMRTYPMKGGKPQKDGKGTPYIIGGSAGPKFYPGEKQEYVDVLYAEEKQVYTSLAVNKNEIKVEAYTTDNELVDSHTFTKQLVEKPEEPGEQEKPTGPEEKPEQPETEEKPGEIEHKPGDEQEKDSKGSVEKPGKDSQKQATEPEKPEDEPKRPEGTAINMEDNSTGSDGKQMNPAKQSEAERTETSKLPNTATSIYNWLALGILVLLIGVVLYLRLRKAS